MRRLAAALAAVLLGPLLASCEGRTGVAPAPSGSIARTGQGGAAADASSAFPVDTVEDASFDAQVDAGEDASFDAQTDSGADAAAEPPECPPEMARVGRACIDRWEAHLVTVAEGGTVTAHPHVERPEAGVRYEARSEAGVFPQGYISRVEAGAACHNAGKRLCSMSEWVRACEGRHETTYPYGPHALAGRCNSGKAHLLRMRFGADARRWKYDENFNDPTLDAEPGFLARTGAYDGCASEAGVLDLVGNLHEWVSDTVDQDFIDKVQAEDVERHHQPWREGNGVFVGGFFSTTSELGPGCKYVTYAHEPTYHDYSTGFRCCEPARLPASPKEPRRKPTPVPPGR